MPNAEHFWVELFPHSDVPPARQVPMRLVHRQGRPFLLLPQTPAAAAACLDLYSASSFSKLRYTDIASKEYPTHRSKISIPFILPPYFV